MSILIQGMALPPRGKVNLLVMFDDGMVQDNSDVQNQWRAIELPLHGRLIDADALKIYQMEENLRADGDPNENEYDAGLIDGLHMAAKDVSVAPTIIPAEGGEDG